MTEELGPRARRPATGTHRTRRTARWREAARAKEAGWDRRLARVWGSLLITGFLMPLGYAPVVDGPSRFVFVWDVIGEVPPLTVVWLLLPLALGVTTLVASAVANARVRGTVILLGSLLVAVIPVVVSGPLLFDALAPRALHLIALWLIVLLAPPLIAGANHVARRAGADVLLRILMGAGGLSILLALFVPIGSDGTSILGLLFGSRGPFGQAGEAWPILIWVLLVLLYAGVAALAAIPTIDAGRLGGWLSITGRFALYGLPLSIVLMILFTGARVERGFGGSLLVLVGGMLRLYGVMILTALGLALVLDRTPPTQDPHRLVEAF